MARPYTGPPIATANADRCDFLDAAVCLQPWPNDYFTAEDESTDTGRLIDLNPLSMPRNRADKPIDPSDYNHNDGFSPGQLIVTKVPGLETPAAFEATGAVSLDEPELYDDPDQPVVVINAETGERHPIFAELDANPTDPHRPNPGTTRRRQPPDPPARQLRGGSALHRRPPRPQGRRGQSARARRRLPGLPRPPDHRAERGRGAPAPHGGAVRDAAGRRRCGAPTSIWPGTSPSPASAT